jgi:hypothetical protein
MADIRRQFGLDIQRSETKEAQPSPLDEALIAYGRPMLDALRKAEPNPMGLHELIDMLDIPISAALDIVEAMKQRRYLDIVRYDNKGNHELRIAPEGMRLLRG